MSEAEGNSQTGKRPGELERRRIDLVMANTLVSRGLELADGLPAETQEILPSHDASDERGLSWETAVAVASVGEEYEWIAREFPGSTVRCQALAASPRGLGDVITIVTSDDRVLDLYFDIAEIF